ncbi:hypothetical protein PPL_11099 [Heterostelium album PN500]|uniref:Uncharacterized protein n=1 Tax=Heterostelium pallidum (strain ATCC 26659 / Pp 5 / PN500) TaxID=670386 RepID=D3BSX9_HETP5|nr:hypothetical protein PPL_11099 [Heterostelium album PN500]EFA75594.1 hypothetical protein PPL_11099 [Heterostelium album PN500]|eukprot:XP_020427728.1 hypothetical protein PPL_11099 [Heterostelium album PN500]
MSPINILIIIFHTIALVSLVAACLIPGGVVQGQCISTPKCVGIGDSCASELHSTCPSNAFCDSLTFVCKAKGAAGDSCTTASSGVCIDGYTCVNSKCTAVKYLGMGETCASTIQCSGTMLCTNSVCTNPSFPNCTSSFDCHWNETCKPATTTPGGVSSNTTTTCSPISQDGDFCSANADCEIYSSCSKSKLGVLSKCMSPFSVDQDGSCQLDTYTTCDLTKNLSCSSNSSTCAPMSGDHCLPFNATQMKSTLTSLQSCRINNRCPLTNNETPKSCSPKNCGTDFKALQSLLYQCPPAVIPSTANVTSSTTSSTTTTTGKPTTTSSTTGSDSNSDSNSNSNSNDSSRLINRMFKFLYFVVFILIISS